MSLSDALIDAVNYKYSFELKTDTKCRYAQQSALIDSLACSCDQSGTRDEQCFPITQDLPFSAVRVTCVNRASVIQVRQIQYIIIIL
jgi:hypothetical protein